MTVALVPSSTLLIDYAIGLSTHYLSLHQENDGLIDVRFREPAETVLGTIGGSFTFDEPRISSDFVPERTLRIHNHLEIAQYIAKRGGSHRYLWRDRLNQAPELQEKLWTQLETAANGLIRAGYETYDAQGHPNDWATQIQEKSLALSLRAIDTEARPLAAVQETDAPTLSLLIHHLDQSVKAKSYRRSADLIGTIRTQTNGMAIHNSATYLETLLAIYPLIPFGETLRDIVAAELEESGQESALNVFSLEAFDIFNYWGKRV